MDLNNIEIPKLKIPKLSEVPAKLKLKLKEYFRVYKITKKPNTEEFKAIVKITGLGIMLIGVIGFTIFLIIALISGMV